MYVCTLLLFVQVKFLPGESAVSNLRKMILHTLSLVCWEVVGLVLTLGNSWAIEIVAFFHLVINQVFETLFLLCTRYYDYM